jgi:DNA-binding NtrC family response regulator
MSQIYNMPRGELKGGENKFSSSLELTVEPNSLHPLYLPASAATAASIDYLLLYYPMSQNGQAPDKSSILLIDDNPNFLATIAELLRHGGYSTMTASSGEAGLALLGDHARSIDLVLLDVRMPGGMDGLDTLEQIVRSYPHLPVIMLTGENAIDLVIRALKGGATNYIHKGAGGSELLAAVGTALEQSGALQKDQASREELESYGVYGRSSILQRLINDARTCARSNISVLITGETGVGKDLLARAIHAMSHRAGKPFVILDVPNIPATMFESELFGHTRGAFTGATDSKQGLIQAASSGTLFLDEIGEFPIEFQAKFLRVLDSQTVRKLGSVTPETVDVRIVSATNRNLLDAVRNREFREDLLYRLRGIELHVPPLRERREDIAPLATHFLNDFVSRNNLEPKRLTPAAISLLERQRWSGNIRELRRAIEAVTVLTEGEIVEHTDIARVLERADPMAGAEMTVVQNYGDVQMLARQTKREELMKVLDRNEWNITRAAAELDIDRSTLSKQMKSLGIEKPKLRR